MTIVSCYRITDKSGGRVDVATPHDEEYVSVEGLVNADGEPVQFEYKASGLEAWAEEEGLEYEAFEVQINFDTRRARVA